MQQYGLIGEKLGHSVSPQIHEAIWAKLGLRGSYRLIEIPRERLGEDIRRLLDTLDGFNVTVPYKTDVMPLLDELDPFAQGVGAVNTVISRRHGPARGFNTDEPGFAQMLIHFGMDPKGQRVYILGSGGAMHACRAAVKRLGARQVSVVSRQPAHEDEIDYAAFYDRFPDEPGLIINTTPVGMYPNGTGCPLAPDAQERVLRRALGVADIIFNPPETVLTARARALGIPACTGMYMLIAQAVEAESIWQGRSMPEGMAAELMRELHLL